MSLPRCIAFALVVLLFGPAAGAQDRRLNQDRTGLPQGEAMIRVNPNDPQHLVATWIDWDSPRGQANTTFHARSLDGGATWLTAETIAPGTPLRSRIDPAVTFDGLGNVFAIFATPQHVLDFVWVARSNDGGLSFVGATPVAAEFSDKPWIAADPVNNNVYAVWVGLGPTAGGVQFSRSLNSGVTFSTPVGISTGQTPMVDVGPGGEVYVVYLQLQPPSILMDRSLDGGVNWLSSDEVVSSITMPPATLAGGLKSSIIPTLAVDRTGGAFNGRIYVVWTDSRDGDPDAYLSFSSDQGNNWSAPARVNGDVPGGGADQVHPTVWVNDDGHVHVMYLDRREDPENLRLSVYLATSTDGGVTFGPDVRVSEPGLAQGGTFGSPHTWLGDYIGGAAAGGVSHIVWSDGRAVDQDIYYRRVDDTDFDEDGILNDGSGDGQYASARCTGGQTVSCDDNCPGRVNPTQTDADGDLVGDACDSCPSTSNTNQFDTDRDGAGDACDPCPANAGRPAGDPDVDGVPECTDNCPGVANAGQTDGDMDGIGDTCDACPSDAANDADGDGFCSGADTCPTAWNPEQADTDGDLAANACDVCPSVPGAQTDTDGDGQGDACDCQPLDLLDRGPRRIGALRAFKTGTTAAFGWIGRGVSGPGSSGQPGVEFDAYSVSRGLLSVLRSTGSFGPCFAEGWKRGFEDASIPPDGDGYVYLVQGQNFDCGVGSLGFGSDEIPRSNIDAGACTGQVFSDVFASSQTTISGTVTGSLGNLLLSDDVYETVTEVRIGGISQMEKRFTFTVPGGSGLVEVHSEGFWIPSSDQEPIRLEWSSDGGTNFTPVFALYQSTTDQDLDGANAIPPMSGTLIIRLIDTDRSSGSGPQDAVSLDQLWIRAVP